MQVVTAPQAELSPVLRAEVERLDRTAWPTSTSSEHDPLLEPYRVILLEYDTAVATLAILSKPIEHDGVTLRASGLSAVVTDPERRREGLGHRLVITARSVMRERGADLGLFTCDRELVNFYETGGFLELPGTALLGGTPDDPLVSDELGKVALAAFFSDLAKEHATSFSGARIALYPGAIDKLW